MSLKINKFLLSNIVFLIQDIMYAFINNPQQRIYTVTRRE
jgi:uncharacterized membrane protein